MTVLLLDGYRPVKMRWPVYTLDTVTKRIDTQWFSNQAAGKAAGPVCGCGDFRRIGKLWERHDGFFALYAHGRSLHLWLDGESLKIDERQVQVRRSTDILLRKRFRVIVDDRVIFECRYSHLDYEDFPDQDIFRYMTRSFVDAELRRRTRLIWEDKAKGVDQSSGGYFADLEERVKSV
jgi:hypothetical protein